MPLSRGIMQIGRLNVYPTTTTLVSINPPGYANCGDVITFTVTVVNDKGSPTPTGVVRIKDSNTGNMISDIAFATLSGGTATINAILANGSIQAYAEYVGIFNQFAKSKSDNVLYNVNITSTIVTILNPSDGYFCSHQPYQLGAHVQPSIGGPATGSVVFNLYSSATSFTTIGSANLDGSGNAYINLPADSTVPGNNYYIQAIYQGAGCFGVSASTPGTSGLLIHAIDSSTNTTSISAAFAGDFFIYSPMTIYATVNSAYLGNPSVGSVTWTATQDLTILNLGTDNSVINGAASLLIPDGTFPSAGNWNVVANYVGNNCFANSTSSSIIVTPTTYSVSMLKYSGSTTFCYAVAQQWTYYVSSTLNGIISGTFYLKSSLGNTLATTVITNGNASGFYVNMQIPAFTSGIGNQNFYLEFVPDGSRSCYAASISSNTATSVKSFLNQTPNLTVLGITPNTGFTNTTFTFTITVYKGSGVGPLDGAGSLNGTATLYVNYGSGYNVVNSNIHINDNGSYGSGSYASSGFASGSVSFLGRYNGNLCYNFQNSLSVVINIDPIIH